MLIPKGRTDIARVRALAEFVKERVHTIAAVVAMMRA
jgi:hypothetical protein